MRNCVIFFLALTSFLSCTKADLEDVTSTFYGGLPIVATSTPKNAVAGQDINSAVRCELPGLGGSVYFQGFDIRETAPRQFAVSANALYKDWNTQIHATVIWRKDTSVSIPTRRPGTYIIRFYTNTHLVKADTVLVN